MGKDIADLADGDERAALCHEAVQDRLVRRRDGEVLAIAGAGEARLRRPDEGAGDDAPDPQRIDQHAHLSAQIVEAFEPEMLFVRGDLQHGVDGGVADRFAGRDVLSRELVDDRGARGVPVAEDAGQGAGADDRER